MTTYRRSALSSAVCTMFALGVLAGLLAAPQSGFADDPGYALRFDGISDHVSLAATSSLMAPEWPTSKTVSLWVKPIGTPTCTGPAPGSCDAIFGDRPRTWGISRGVLNGSDRIWIWNYDSTFDQIGIEYTAGQWMHIALVHGGGLLRAYRNGVLVGSTPSGPTQLGGQTVLHFGGIINSVAKNWTFEGEIDELQIWNVVRTASEITEDMSHSLSGNEAGLAAYYKMSDGSGTTVTDDSVNSWTGTLNDGGNNVPPDGPIMWVPSGAFGGSGTVNTPPVANPQTATTPEDTARAITLTGSDAEGSPLTFQVVTQPTHGGLTGTAPNLTYTPNANFNGTDNFTFKANDGLADSAAATVSITITPVNDAPASSDGSTTANEDSSGVNVSLAGLVSDLETADANLTYTIVTDPGNGVITGSGTDRTYTPNDDFFGADQFTFRVTDRGDPDNCTPVGPSCAASLSSATKTVTITVNSVNDSPSFTSGANQTVPEDASAQSLPWATQISAGPSNESSQTLNFIVTNDNNGLFSAQPALTPSGTLTYTPGLNKNGSATVTVRLHDNGGTTSGGVDTSDPQNFTITITPVNDPPAAANDTATTAANSPVVVQVLSNDTDADGHTLSVIAVGTAANGTIQNNNTHVTYTPNSGFTGIDSFTYDISDGNGGVDDASVTVTVNPPASGPGYALRFDGASDFVSLGATANMMALNWQTTKTVSLWVKPIGTPYCNVPSPASCDAIFGDRPRWWGISRGVINGFDRIWVWNWDGNLDVVWMDYTAGEWLNIAMVHGNGILSAYKNGVLVGTVPSGPTQQPTTGALPILHFGGIINNATRNWTFQGDIDELRIWNIARTTAEINQDMNQPLTGAEPGLAAYYKMSDGSGLALTDDSGHGWTGMLNDGGTGVPADGPINWVPSGAFGPGGSPLLRSTRSGPIDYISAGSFSDDMHRTALAEGQATASDPAH